MKRRNNNLYVSASLQVREGGGETEIKRKNEKKQERERKRECVNV